MQGSLTPRTSWNFTSRDCLESPDGHQTGATEANIEGQGDRIFALQASDLASLTPLQPTFQTVSRRGILGSTYTGSCIKRSLAAFSRRVSARMAPPLSLHVVVLNGYALPCIPYAPPQRGGAGKRLPDSTTTPRGSYGLPYATTGGATRPCQRTHLGGRGSPEASRFSPRSSSGTCSPPSRPCPRRASWRIWRRPPAPAARRDPRAGTPPTDPVASGGSPDPRDLYSSGATPTLPRAPAPAPPCVSLRPTARAVVPSRRPLRPVEYPSSGRRMVTGLTRVRIESLDIVPGAWRAPILARAEEALRSKPRGS